MSRIFFYGTLRDRRLAEIVLGRRLADDCVVEARAPGHQACRLAEVEYPLLLPTPGQTAEGVVLTDIGPADLARLAYFEDTEYQLSPIEVETEAGPMAVRYFEATEVQPATDEPWDYDAWRKADRLVAIEAARALMEQYGRLPFAEIDTLWPAIMTRARQRARGAATPLPAPTPGALRTPFGPTDVAVVRRRTAYAGFLAVEELRLRHRLFEGGLSEEIERTTVAWGDAVTLLPYDPLRDRVLLIEQFRPGAVARGERAPWCIEVVAGRLDGAARAEETARREAKEEAGLEIGRIRETGTYYTSPGLSAETITGFVGEAFLPRLGDGAFLGLEGENEDIRTVVLGTEQALAAVARGEINTGPALVALLWLAANRDALRAEWGDGEDGEMGGG